MDQKDKKMLDRLKRIKQLCESLVNYVVDFGNMCAYTDRGIERVIELSQELKDVYNSKWEELK